MHNRDFKTALDDFLQRRIDDCGMRRNEALEEAYRQFEHRAAALGSMLTPQQTKLYLDCELAYSAVDGETMNCYYRAGFSDAVLFFTGWRDGEWN